MRKPGSIWSCQRCIDLDEVVQELHKRVQFEQAADPDWDKSVVGMTKRQREHRQYWEAKKETENKHTYERYNDCTRLHP